MTEKKGELIRLKTGERINKQNTAHGGEKRAQEERGDFDPAREISEDEQVGLVKGADELADKLMDGKGREIRDENVQNEEEKNRGGLA